MSTISLCSFEMSTTDADKGIADDKKMDKATSTGRKIVVAMDGSEHALYALDCMYLFFFNIVRYFIEYLR